MKHNYRFYLCLLFCVCMFATKLHAQNFVAPFGTNPDPNIVYHDGWYYYSGTSGNGVYLKRAQTLEGLKHTTMTKIFSEANGGPCCDYWAPEMFRINNKWYIYYTAKYTGEGQRTYVIENSAADPMSGTWVHKGKIYDSQADFTAIDGTVLETNGQMYFIWSGIAKAEDQWRPQRLYIARMTNPWTLQPGRVLLASPQYSWELDGNVNEGPAIIKHGGKIFLTYSANACWTPNYLIGTLYMTEGGNPMNAALWTKHNQPLFTSYAARDVYAPGHHSFFTSPDGNETWFVYHATPEAAGSCGMDRSTRAQKLQWSANGFPSFGIPDPTGAWLTAPSGEVPLPVGPTIPNGIYKIRATSSTDKVLDVSGCSSIQGTTVHQWLDNGLDCQKWHIIATPDGYYSINSVKGGLALDVTGCGTENGTAVQTWNPSGADCQKWKIVEVSAGVYRIISKKSGRVLDIQFGGNNNGSKLQIYDYLGNAQQHFALELIESYGLVSWESHNFPGHFIRHQNGRVRIDKNVSPAEDGQWRMVPGLAGKGVSFQSVNFPNSYLRHSDGAVVSGVNDGSTIFREDATYYIRPGLADASKVSFESYNYPGNYLRHRNYLLYSEPVSAGTGYNDATFSKSVLNMSPVVSLTAPANNATVIAPASITINATATDSDGSVTKVEFFNGSTKLAEKTAAPYNYTWTNVGVGTYTITAKATDNKGATSTSSARTVTVTSNTPNQAPVVSLTAPANNATYNAPASITITATATDSDGSIAKVEFFNGTTKLGEKTTSPYSYTWTNVGAGSYSITAKATDDKGATTTSAARSVVVNATVNQPPAVSLTAPVNNATFTAPASITITATATDGDGTIAKVEFYNGSTKLGEKTTSPYTYTWTNVAAGTYSFTAKATDNKGAATTSAARSVTVNPPANLCTSLAVYKENGGYAAGSKVQNVGNRYECKPWPYSGWCNGAAWAYAPGTGSYWQDAWTLVGSCSGNARSASDNTAGMQLNNFPNPVADYTDIEVTVVEAGEVSVNIYDQTGQLVKVVKEGYVGTGSHLFPLDATELKAGVYIVQFKSNEGTVRHKMVKLQ